MLIASPMRAAGPIDSPAAAPAPEPAARKAVVVHADPRTGRLVRSVVVSPRPAKAAPSAADIGALIDQAARAHDVDPLLVHSMIKVESNFDPNAVSAKGAEGLMQLTPSTARMLGVGDSFDPGQNIEGGVKYLKYLQGLYKDDRLALAAYNAGPGAVEKYKWIPPYRETRNYVYQVGKRYGEARRTAAADSPAPAADPAPQIQEERHPKLVQHIDENGRLYLSTEQ